MGKKGSASFQVFFKRAGRHQKGAGRHTLQKQPRQNTDIHNWTDQDKLLSILSIPSRSNTTLMELHSLSMFKKAQVKTLELARPS